MKIMLCPYPKHLYLLSLSKHLEEQDVYVNKICWFGKQTPLSLLQLLIAKINGSSILHLHWIPFNWLFMMVLVQKLSNLLNIKVVWTIHNLTPHTPIFGSTEKDEKAFKYMAKWASAGIVHSEKTKEDFYKIYGIPLPLFVIPHGNFNEYAQIKSAEESRKKLGIPLDKTVLLMFPPNRWTKGIKTFIEVIKKLPDDYLGILAGKCDDLKIKKYLLDEKNKNQSKILINLDYIPSAEMGYYFGVADIFFMPYDRITTSGSVIHAMAYKKSIISTPNGNLYMLVENCVNGYLCNTTEEMMEEIKTIDRKTAVKMGEKSYEIAERFDWKDIANKTIEVYKKAIGDAKKK